MSDSVLFFISSFFASIWSLFTSFKIPGLNFTPAVLFFGILSFNLLIFIVKNILFSKNDD